MTKYQLWVQYGFTLHASYLPCGQFDAHIDAWYKWKWKKDRGLI